MSGELQGRVIAITGATGGIGRAVALAAAREGAQLIVVGRNLPGCRACTRSSSNWSRARP